ncbi:hypothetical protein [Lentibacter sp. XHP0401]|uniref:hypothetical protein n=1 Tax=Lentibacter sp. XHP0401 TaxID=2984334 RepID=UPI0021E757CC|nr:hypothetical protein [Lentibacter sp. XHP0401]MCV2892226.1 hypothetical protein [Lentibacter sp. XHP0401]
MIFARQMYIGKRLLIAGTKMRTVIFSSLLLFGCGPAQIGSSAWFNGASQSERVAYYQGVCESYGFKPKTDKMAECIAREIDSARQRLEAVKARAFEPSSTTICNTYGATTICS